MEHPLFLYNTLTRKKERFEPLNAPHVGMYVCGPTVYSNVHLGNVRSFLSFDMLFRYLTHLGYNVRYVRNITDVGHLTDDADSGEDKIAKRARLMNLEPMEVVQEVTVDFHRVMQMFNAKAPSIEPTATGHILEQIKMVQDIMAAGLAYEVNGSVYFDVEKYHQDTGKYGQLSGRIIEDLQSAGDRSEEEQTRSLDGQADKRSALDFAIWKKAEKEHIMRWDSPWGEGFPGWHLECSVMSTKYLGETFDIHGGGMDLKFPHHECEIAQNVAATGVEQPVRYWLHGNMLTVNGVKMSKGLGNVVTPDELVFGGNEILNKKGYSAMAARFFMLLTHYSSTLDISAAALEGAEKAYKRMMKGIRTLSALTPSETSDYDVSALVEKCKEAINDDLNTPTVIAHLFDGVRIINSAKEGTVSLTADDITALKALYEVYIFEVMGLQDDQAEGGADDGVVDGLMQMIIAIRKEARANKNWATSDLIRDELGKLNIALLDGKDGTTYDLN